MKTIEKILIEASSCKNIDDLINLWNEIAKNKYNYTLNELNLARKTIRELSLKTNGLDIVKGKFYHHLTQS